MDTRYISHEKYWPVTAAKMRSSHFFVVENAARTMAYVYIASLLLRYTEFSTEDTSRNHEPKMGGPNITPQDFRGPGTFSPCQQLMGQMSMRFLSLALS